MRMPCIACGAPAGADCRVTPAPAAPVVRPRTPESRRAVADVLKATGERLRTFEPPRPVDRAKLRDVVRYNATDDKRVAIALGCTPEHAADLAAWLTQTSAEGHRYAVEPSKGRLMPPPSPFD